MSERAWLTLFRGAVLVVFLTVFPFLPALNNPNENTRVYLAMALVDHGTFRLDAVVRRHGWTNDMARVPDANGTPHYAAAKGPLLGYLGVPLYATQRGILALLGQRPPGPDATAAEAAAWLKKTTLTLQFFGVHLPCALFLLVLERRLRRWSSDLTLRLTAVVAVGLGTNFLAYSFSFVSHAWSSIAAFLALDHIARERMRARGDPERASPRVALVAGLVAGLPTLLEYQGAVLSLILGMYGFSIFRRPRAAAAFACGALVDAAALMLFQWRSFGSPLRTGVLFMENPAFRASWNEGFLGFSAPRKEALLGLLFDGGYGLFGTSPWLWLGLLGVAAPWLVWGRGKGRRERQIQLGVAAAMFWALTLLMASGNMWRGGWTIGPRYLGAAPGLLVLPGLALAEALARRVGREPVRVLSGALALASFVRGGAIGLMVVTLPESIVRPLPQILLPFLRDGLAPHHLLELAGLPALWPWRLTAAVALGLAVLAVLASRGPRSVVALRGAVALTLAALLLLPALRMPEGARDEGPAVRAFFRSIWVPGPRAGLGGGSSFREPLAGVRAGESAGWRSGWARGSGWRGTRPYRSQRSRGWSGTARRHQRPPGNTAHAPPQAVRLSRDRGTRFLRWPRLPRPPPLPWRYRS
jgi:hypothetical protein